VENGILHVLLAISIKNIETERFARETAAQAGESLTEAIRKAGTFPTLQPRL
jgi:hypothetical protein